MAQMQPSVAIVDDDAAIQRALARLLTVAGWQVVTFASAEAFLETNLRAALDCLVLDVWLPGMTGIALLEHLVATGRMLPAVIITAYDDLQLRLWAMQAGAVAYLLKPIEWQELVQVLQEVRLGAANGRELAALR